MKVQSLAVLILIGSAFIAGLTLPVAGAGQGAELALTTTTADWYRKIWNMDFVGQIGGPTTDLVIQGHYAYVNIGPRVVVFDISDPADLTVIGQTDMLPDKITDVFVSGRHLYVTWSFCYVQCYSGLQVFDISNPATPSLAGAYFIPDTPTSNLYVAGHYAYLSNPWGILRIIDVSDPTTPVERSHYQLPKQPKDIHVVGAYAYIAVFVGPEQGGLLIMDVSNPESPSEVGLYLMAGFASGIDIVGHYVYVAKRSGLEVLDISNPIAPVRASTVETSGYPTDVYVAGNYAYLAGWEGLQIVDVSDPVAPYEVGDYNVQRRAREVSASGDYVYIAGEPHGLQVVDVSNPANPVEVDNYDPPDSASDIKIIGNYAYVISNNLHVIDISNPTAPVQVGLYQFPRAAYSIDIAGRYAYVATVGAGLWVIDISNPTTPRAAATYPAPEYVQDVDVVSGSALDPGAVYAYLAAGREGLRIIDVSDPTAPTEVGIYLPGGFLTDVHVAGGYAYIGWYECPAGAGECSGGLLVVDVSNPAVPEEVGVYNTPWSIDDVTVADGYAYLAAGGLQVIDISNPSTPVRVAASPYLGATAVHVKGNYAYLGFSGAYRDAYWIVPGVRVFDVSNPTAPVEVGRHRTRGSGLAVAMAGNSAADQGHIYVGDGEEGVRIFRFQPTATVTIPANGGRLVSPTDGTTYDFAAGTFIDTVTINHVLPPPDEIPATGRLADIGHAFVMSAVYSDTGQPAYPTRSYTLTVQYTAAEKGPAIESTLTLYAWDGTQWVREPTSAVDAEANTVTATPDHFSLWAVLGEMRRMFLPVVLTSD